MADEFDADEFLSDVGIDPTDGTPLVKMLRQKLKDQGKAQKQLADELAALKTEKATVALKNTWDELGVPEPIRGFYQGEQDPDSIKSWWEASQGFFNVKQSNTETPQAEAPNEQHQQLQQVQQAATLGQDQPSNLSLDAFRQGAEEVRKTSAKANPNALDEWLSKNGITQGAITPPRVG